MRSLGCGGYRSHSPGRSALRRDLASGGRRTPHPVIVFGGTDIASALSPEGRGTRVWLDAVEFRGEVRTPTDVIPAKAGTQLAATQEVSWVPACAGMTNGGWRARVVAPPGSVVLPLQPVRAYDIALARRLAAGARMTALSSRRTGPRGIDIVLHFTGRLVFARHLPYMTVIRFSRHGSDRPVRRLLGSPDLRNVLDRRPACRGSGTDALRSRSSAVTHRKTSP